MKILIVEDNADLRELLTIIIRRLGHEVAVAITGEQAVERASAVKPDLILMDIRLPSLNGIEATRQIKAGPLTKDIPVVILSAFSISSHGRHAIEAGAVEILQKPVSVTDLEQVLIKYTCTESKAATESPRNSVSTNRFQQTNNIPGGSGHVTSKKPGSQGGGDSDAALERTDFHCERLSD